MTGPDLKDVLQRQNRDWLVTFLQNPKAIIDQGDPYALELFKESRGVVMPNVPGMNGERAQALLDLISEESKLEESQFVGVKVSDRPFTPEDIAAGRALFQGRTSLINQGPSCISCHTMKGLSVFGGGRLGPDLTHVFERLQGRQSMAAWLSAPPMVTMQSVFGPKPLKPEEILLLIGFFENTANQSGEDMGAGVLSFFLAGMGGAVMGLVMLDQIWKDRLRRVRQSLIQKVKVR